VRHKTEDLPIVSPASFGNRHSVIMQNEPPQHPPLLPTDPFKHREYQLNWGKDDLEQRLGFRGGRFTSANKLLTFLSGALLTTVLYVLITFALKPIPQWRWLSDMFLDRGPTQYATMFLFFWALSILFVKWRKLCLQRKALALAAIPSQADFILNPDSAPPVLERIHTLVDSTSHFLLLNRIERALSNLKNIGQISDVSNILQTQAEYDEEQVSSSYSLVGGFVWAIPVLGFIGTVLGLSVAIGSFSTTLKAGGNMDAIRGSLESVTLGLATAFETTLVALVCALILQLLITYLQGRESEFLDDCNDYCHANVVAKLRLMR
jgi:biopolymer transport protein ExbB/TolQ